MQLEIHPVKKESRFSAFFILPKKRKYGTQQVISVEENALRESFGRLFDAMQMFGHSCAKERIVDSNVGGLLHPMTRLFRHSCAKERIVEGFLKKGFHPMTRLFRHSCAKERNTESFLKERFHPMTRLFRHSCAKERILRAS